MKRQSRHFHPGGPAGSAGADSSNPAVKFAGLGIQFAVLIVVFLYIGKWLDQKFGTSPLLLIVGVFVGAGAGFYGMYRALMAAMNVKRPPEPKDP